MTLCGDPSLCKTPWLEVVALWDEKRYPSGGMRLLTGACAEHRLEDDAHHSPKNWGNNDASDEQAERRDLWIGRAAGHRANEGETAARHDAASH